MSSVTPELGRRRGAACLDEVVYCLLLHLVIPKLSIYQENSRFDPQKYKFVNNISHFTSPCANRNLQLSVVAPDGNFATLRKVSVDIVRQVS